MSKFEVGEIVRIRDDLVDGKIYGGLCCYFHLSRRGGETGVISKISSNGNYKIFDKWFSEEMIESCEDERKSKFKDDYFELVEPSLSFDFKIDKDLWEKAILGIWQKNDDMCDFCKYNGECNGLTNHGNGPVYPPCADLSPEECINYNISKETMEEWLKDGKLAKINDDSLDSFRYWLENYEPNIYYMKEEENKMSDVMKIYEDKKENKVLELWFRRKGNEIEKKYDDLKSKYINEKYSVVKSYEDTIEDFERQLEELYKYDNANEQFVLKENNTCNVFKYVLDENKLVEEAEQFYKEDKKKEMQDILNTYNEINALLSMSEDLEYQQSVLIEYGIIDKKTKRMINEDNTK